MGKAYRIGELAEVTNVSKRTIDYYSQIGLLQPLRTDSNYRLYDEETIHVLGLIEHYKKLNMPLHEIKSVIELVKLKSTENEQVEKYVDQIAELMKHLEAEIKEIKPIMESLNDKQRELLLNKVSPQGMTLAHSLLLLFG
ncbi:MAG: MerR family transcriptional regulator [Bacillota bacterium]|uniref:MerR family transcriptional regulator n=1 Tax=Fictibacillus TaxID=1329200 RepID=UPI0011A0B7A7|nr:MerR family transcriptional regulator [Fictibacillus phosphorivorans]MBH0171589.1 MerR family transcriptional regulator [Fictibacillus sp. 18YEL24]